ncbi:DUF5301 domain-containing protein [Eubacterium coprostanoligenes]|uniref:DUF5301 domain-containing protein n=1 Tax=Eubacterium coprostanoligenes TaxID=290054 RepID=UPI002357BF74|nr:DUF5301 domain-containing protein [Eubacterium coprostanoligenes]MCI6254230.1 DUF5301 domain-containing protein [Eubacterium coprostanoligenes]MDY5399246.1 DUF5301 domain-containing protein [Eubacterium coprostanoligenes]
MKKCFSVIICVACILTLFACSKKANPIVLPQSSDVVSVDVIDGENTVNCSDKIWIDEVISGLSDSKPTNKQSVQDFPQVDNYIKVELNSQTEKTTVFVYKDKGKFYIEQPYNGIYIIDSDLYKMFWELY